MGPPPDDQVERFPGPASSAELPMPTLPELMVVTGVNVQKEMGKVGVVIGFDKMSGWDVCRAVDYQLVEQNKMFRDCPELLAVEMALKQLQQNARRVRGRFRGITMRPSTHSIANLMLGRPNPNRPPEADLPVEQFLSKLCTGLPPMNWISATLSVYILVSHFAQ